MPKSRTGQEVLDLENDIEDGADEAKSLDAEAAILISKVGGGGAE